MRSPNEIIKLIMKRKDELNLSSSELARRVNIPKSTQSRYENGSREFPINLAANYASVLDLDIGYLLGIEDPKDSYDITNMIDIFSTLPEELQLNNVNEAKILLVLSGYEKDKLDKLSDDLIIDLANIVRDLAKIALKDK